MYETNYQTPAQVPYGNPMQPNVESVKKFFSSPLFLALGILGLVNCLLAIISSANPVNALNLSELQSALNELGLEIPANYYNLNFSMKIDLIPIATSIAFILFYAFARQPGNKIKAPAMILKVVSIIQFVLVCVVIGLCFIIFALAFAIGSVASNYIGSSEADMAMDLVGIIFVLLLIVLGFVFFFSFAVFRFYSGIHKTITTPELKKNFSTFIGVMQIISLVITTPALILAPASLASPVLILSSLGSIAYNVLFIIFIFRYTSFIKGETSRRYFEQNNQSAYSETPVSGVANNYYNNPYTAPQEIPQPVNETPVIEASAPVENPQTVCKQCGNPVSDNDSFCMSCGTPIER